MAAGRTSGGRPRLPARRQAEGVLLLGARRSRRAAGPGGAPVVLAGRPLDDVALPYVDVDNLGGAQAAVRHLLASGRRRIGTIAGPADMGAAVDRLAASLAAREAGMGVNGLVCQGDLGRLSGERAMARCWSGAPTSTRSSPPDQMAVGALSALRRAGRRVPDDVAVVGSTTRRSRARCALG